MVFPIAALTVGALVWMLLGLAEARGDVPGTRLESRLMTAALHGFTPPSGGIVPELANPLPPTDENLIAGARIFLNDCAGCQGTPGKPTDDSDTLYPPVPQFAKVGTQYTEAPIFWSAKHGIRRTGMFANGKWDRRQAVEGVGVHQKDQGLTAPGGAGSGEDGGRELILGGEVAFPPKRRSYRN